MNIAIADDEKLILAEMEYLVKEAVPNADVFSFTSSEALLKSAKKTKYDIAFLDIQMPVIDGVELAKRLKKINEEINIIFATSFSEYTGDAIKLHASGYLKKPVTVEEIKAEMDNLLYPVKSENSNISIRTFGNFCVFSDGKPVHFRRDKEGEMLAYLVDRRGAPISRKEIAAVIFEDGDFSRNRQVYLSNIVHDLIEDLENAGAKDLFIKDTGAYYVDTEKFSCDMYDYLAGDEKALDLFDGEYMEQYSWAEYLKDKFY